MRPLFFALTGIVLLAFWIVFPPLSATSSSLQGWPSVLSFTGILLLQGAAIWVYGRMVGGTWVVRLATVAAIAVALAGLENIFEDGFRIEELFLVFVALVWVLDLSLLALSITILRSGMPRAALLAAVPALELAGVLLFPPAGGPILLGAWLLAAWVARAAFSAAREGARQ